METNCESKDNFHRYLTFENFEEIIDRILIAKMDLAEKVNECQKIRIELQYEIAEFQENLEKSEKEQVEFFQPRINEVVGEIERVKSSFIHGPGEDLGSNTIDFFRKKPNTQIESNEQASQTENVTTKTCQCEVQIPVITEEVGLSSEDETEEIKTGPNDEEIEETASLNTEEVDFGQTEKNGTAFNKEKKSEEVVKDGDFGKIEKIRTGPNERSVKIEDIHQKTSAKVKPVGSIKETKEIEQEFQETIAKLKKHKQTIKKMKADHEKEIQLKKQQFDEMDTEIAQLTQEIERLKLGSIELERNMLELHELEISEYDAKLRAVREECRQSVEQLYEKFQKNPNVEIEASRNGILRWLEGNSDTMKAILAVILDIVVGAISAMVTWKFVAWLFVWAVKNKDWILAALDIAGAATTFVKSSHFGNFCQAWKNGHSIEDCVKHLKGAPVDFLTLGKNFIMKLCTKLIF